MGTLGRYLSQGTGTTDSVFNRHSIFNSVVQDTLEGKYMITNLLLHNFKSHKKTDLRFSNLTVLTGINSAGKSSVIQSLLLLRQSHQKEYIHSYYTS